PAARRTRPGPGRDAAGLAAVLRDRPVHRRVASAADRRKERDARAGGPGVPAARAQQAVLAAVPDLPEPPDPRELRLLVRADAAGVGHLVAGHPGDGVAGPGSGGDLAPDRRAGRRVWRPAAEVL